MKPRAPWLRRSIWLGLCARLRRVDFKQPEMRALADVQQVEYYRHRAIECLRADEWWQAVIVILVGVAYRGSTKAGE